MPHRYRYRTKWFKWERPCIIRIQYPSLGYINVENERSPLVPAKREIFLDLLKNYNDTIHIPLRGEIEATILPIDWVNRAHIHIPGFINIDRLLETRKDRRNIRWESERLQNIFWNENTYHWHHHPYRELPPEDIFYLRPLFGMIPYESDDDFWNNQ